MPELPEVEATRDNLTRWTVGKSVRAVWADGSDLEGLVGATFERWVRRGKRLAAVTSGPVVLVQLGMTGRVVRDAIRQHGSIERPYQRVRLMLDDSVVSLVDVRRLGRVALCGSVDEAFAGLGPDALEPLEPQTLGRLLGRTRKAPLKSALMDQARIAGLGNIAVLEACFRARIHPQRSLATLSDIDFAALSGAIAGHLAHTLATTLGHDEIVYVSEGGDNPFLVYAREGQPCPRGGCDGVVQRALVAGRPNFWCPRCQS